MSLRILYLSVLGLPYHLLGGQDTLHS